MARKIFEQKGYDNTSIDDIAEAVDISKTTVFNYFASKESLLIGIADEELEDIKVFLSTDLAKEASPMKRIKLLMERIYYDLTKYIRLNSRILFSTFPENDQEQSRMRRKYKEIFTRLVKEAIVTHELSDYYSVEEIVHSILVCCFGLAIDCYSAGKKKNLQQNFDVAVTILFEGINSSKKLKPKQE